MIGFGKSGDRIGGDDLLAADSFVGFGKDGLNLEIRDLEKLI